MAADGRGLPSGSRWKRLLVLVATMAASLCAGQESPAPGTSKESPSVTPKQFAIPKEKIRELVAQPAGGCLVTDRIMVDGRKIGYMYREKSDREGDNGWRFFAGDESQQYLNDLSHTGVYSVNTVANYDPDIIPLLDTPAPCAFEKIPGSKEYRRVPAP